MMTYLACTLNIAVAGFE